MDIIIHLYIELCVPKGESSGEIYARFGGQLMVSFDVIKPEEVFIFSILLIDASIKDSSRRCTVSYHKPSVHSLNGQLHLQC
ncbi:unnamed protein product [Cuscuta campestris]|uniref:Uncharacterized protein n=1 Tax=Cuscuta campestris TaxID=132261 RepID=A0A484M0L1_9ASTE|nr:unnamed protein product [Cuscuta campestris]